MPNWVAAQLLVRPAGTAHLVYTSGVRKHAERLKAILEEGQKSKAEAKRIKIGWFETAEANARKIFDDIRRYAEGLKRTNGGVIGLNYTGGTKMMSVHAHRVMRDLGLTASLSYLDARSLQMKFDHPNGGDFDVSLDERIRIEIKKLLRLHDDYPDQKIKYEREAKGADAAAGLIGVHTKYSGQYVWGAWCRKNLRELKDDPSAYQRQVERLDGEILPTEEDFSREILAQLNRQTQQDDPKQRISPADVPRYQQKIVAGYRQMLDKLHVNGGDNLRTVVANNSGAFANSLVLAKWLHGMWLEHYTFAQLQSVADGCDINQNGLAINLETVNGEGREFEADVIALRGYQLFYLTCYTGNENNRSKQKLFEALERAAQLGGDEAKVGLVCNSDSPIKLRQECEADWESFASNQIEVFGREDLPVLADELKRWFRGERRKGR